jgi:hypothetical protein
MSSYFFKNCVLLFYPKFYDDHVFPNLKGIGNKEHQNITRVGKRDLYF